MADKVTLKDLEGAFVTRIAQTDTGVTLVLATDRGTFFLEMAHEQDELSINVRRFGDE